MTSLRESPIRRQPPNRPGWLIPVLAVVGVLVVVGLIYAVVAMARGGGSSSDAASPEPSACVTTTVVPGQSLPKPAKVVVNVYNDRSFDFVTKSPPAAACKVGSLVKTLVALARPTA